jgi:hypothetical protein
MKITDPEGIPIEGIDYRLSKEKKAGEKPVRVQKVDQECSITEKISNQEIEFDTSCIGKPHIIKVSYYPNWQATGAEEVYLVSPAFMLVYPNQSHVRLYYSVTGSDMIGSTLTWTGTLIVVLYSCLNFRKKGVNPRFESDSDKAG